MKNQPIFDNQSHNSRITASTSKITLFGKFHDVLQLGYQHLLNRILEAEIVLAIILSIIFNVSITHLYVIGGMTFWRIILEKPIFDWFTFILFWVKSTLFPYYVYLRWMYRRKKI